MRRSDDNSQRSSGIQFYGGQHLPAAYPDLSGICLEPEGFPNAVNEPSFPSYILEPGATFHSTFGCRLDEQVYGRLVSSPGAKGLDVEVGHRQARSSR